MIAPEMRPALDHPLFEVVTTKSGTASIRNKSLNEIMHNQVGPWAEANALYVEQAGLVERLKVGTDELVIFDIGLGAAANALAAITCAQSLGAQARPLRIISFERDLDLLAYALEHSQRFEHFRGYESALHEILDTRSWSTLGICWELRAGNFLELIEQEIFRPHLVFFDPYSPKVNEEMWTTACFEKLRRTCREPAEGGTFLCTYSQATRVRVSMIKAGFFVGYGAATGFKNQTTAASTDFRQLKSPVGTEFLDRYLRSNLRYPYDCKSEEQFLYDQCLRDYIVKLPEKENSK